MYIFKGHVVNIRAVDIGIIVHHVVVKWHKQLENITMHGDDCVRYLVNSHAEMLIN